MAQKPLILDGGVIKQTQLTASDVNITDTPNNFDATDVEGALSELFTSVSDGKTLVAAAITDKGVTTAASDSFSTMASNIGDIVTGGSVELTGDAMENEVLEGKTFYADYPEVKLTGTMPNRGAVNITPSASNQSIAAGYHNGSGVVYGVAVGMFVTSPLTDYASDLNTSDI